MIMRILVVEDDKELQGQLQRRLEHMGNYVNVAKDGLEALYYVGEYAIDLAIIDLGMPRMGGLEVIQRLREESHEFPMLILTARSGWRSKVEGLDAGADDYLTKPFQPEELEARVNALLRRSTGLSQSKLKIGPFTLDLKLSAVFVNNEEITLTAFEYKILEYFMMNPRKVTTKSMLIDRLYDDSEDKDSNVVEVIIARLRKKLDPDAKYQPIETLRGRGYRFICK
ncbi:MAG: two-component system response regulator PhoP [Candidatus Azotimanducaceae bacterium]|jgi:two-component system response regulator PhoP